MAYRTKSDLNQERKMGEEAVNQMKNSPNYSAKDQLELAKKNEKNWEELDDMDDNELLKHLEDMRTNHPDEYTNFWWWRFSKEQAGKGNEDDCNTNSTRYRVFMITQFLSKPFSDDWESDRLTLKNGVVPLITEKQIEDGLDHKTIKRWAWIWHDKDIYTEEDEINDRSGNVKAGESKFKHAHIVVDIPAKVSVSTVSKWFGVPENMIEIFRGRGAFLDGVEYLPHESPKAVEANKTHYEDTDMHASPGFDFRKELNDLQKHRAQFGKRAGGMSSSDTMRMHVMLDGWTMKQCRDDDPITYSKIKNTLPPLRLDFLMDAPPCPFRMNIYVDGPGGIGKSSFCEYIAQAMFPNVDDPYFPVGNDERVTFDGYDGQPVVIFDDMRAGDFIHQFHRSGTMKLLDPHPKKMAQQAKYTRVILNNAVNIINGIQPYDEFISGLAGTYEDKKTGETYEAEDENQAWRRFPLILCIRQDDFDILINHGFINDDLNSMKTMDIFANVQASLKAIIQKLEGEAKEKTLCQVTHPVLEAQKIIIENHDNKISDPNQVPDTMVPVIKNAEQIHEEEEAKVKEEAYAKELEEEERFRNNPKNKPVEELDIDKFIKRYEKQIKFDKKHEKQEMKMLETTIEFSHFFWGYPDGQKYWKDNLTDVWTDSDREYLYGYRYDRSFEGAYGRYMQRLGSLKRHGYNLPEGISIFSDPDDPFILNMPGYDDQYMEMINNDDDFFEEQLQAEAERFYAGKEILSYPRELVRSAIYVAYLELDKIPLAERQKLLTKNI